MKIKCSVLGWERGGGSRHQRPLHDAIAENGPTTSSILLDFPPSPSTVRVRVPSASCNVGRTSPLRSTTCKTNPFLPWQADPFHGSQKSIRLISLSTISGDHTLPMLYIRLQPNSHRPSPAGLSRTLPIKMIGFWIPLQAVVRHWSKRAYLAGTPSPPKSTPCHVS